MRSGCTFGAKPPRMVRPSTSTTSPRRRSRQKLAFGSAGGDEELPELSIVNDQADVGLLVDVGDGPFDADAVAARPFVLRERADVLDGGEGGQRGVRRRLRRGPLARERGYR